AAVVQGARVARAEAKPPVRGGKRRASVSRLEERPCERVLDRDAPLDAGDGTDAVEGRSYVSAVVVVEEGKLDVDVHTVGGIQLLLRAYERVLASGRRRPARGSVHVAERNHIGRERVPLDDRRVAGDRPSVVPPARGELRLGGAGVDEPGIRMERGAIAASGLGIAP